MNLKTGEFYIGRLAITGNHQIYITNRNTKDAKGFRDSPNPKHTSTGYETHIFMGVLDTISRLM